VIEQQCIVKPLYSREDIFNRGDIILKTSESFVSHYLAIKGIVIPASRIPNAGNAANERNAHNADV
jgi:hypothetical protein